MIGPYSYGWQLPVVKKEVGGQQIEELAPAAIDVLMAGAAEVQSTLCSIPLQDRLAVIDAMGRAWKRKLDEGRLVPLIKDLAQSTGYSEALIMVEMGFIPAVLSGGNMERNLSVSLAGGSAALERFVEVQETEFLRQMPAGPSLIISSGNSIVPTLIPTAISLLTGNLTLLKPSLANHQGVIEALRTIEEVPDSPAKDAMRRCLVVSYLSHDSETLDALLSRSAFGAINFWGGEPARTIVAKKVAENVHRPRLYVNGPLTGVAIIDEASADDDAADGLAMNVVLYDQQLCSSPTLALFVGDLTKAQEFARKVATYLDDYGKDMPLALPEGSLFTLQNGRRMLQMRGSTVLSGRSPDNIWTLVISKDRSNMGEVAEQYRALSIHGRRRFLEMVVVPDLAKLTEIINSLPANRAYAGIDKVQTIGLAVPRERENDYLHVIERTGVYRIVPVGDMYMRSAIEPYDGLALASQFTYIVYRRGRNMSLEDVL